MQHDASLKNVDISDGNPDYGLANEGTGNGRRISKEAALRGNAFVS